MTKRKAGHVDGIPSAFTLYTAEIMWEIEWYNLQGVQAVLYLTTLRQGTSVTVARTKKANNWGNMTFVDFRLNLSDHAAYEDWYTQNSKKLDGMVDDLLADGYKLSISPDFDNQCTIVTIISKDPKSVNGEACFTTRSELWLDALSLALYKHYIVAEDTVWPTDKGNRSWG